MGNQLFYENNIRQFDAIVDGNPTYQYDDGTNMLLYEATGIQYYGMPEPLSNLANGVTAYADLLNAAIQNLQFASGISSDTDSEEALNQLNGAAAYIANAENLIMQFDKVRDLDAVASALYGINGLVLNTEPTQGDSAAASARDDAMTALGTIMPTVDAAVALVASTTAKYNALNSMNTGYYSKAAKIRDNVDYNKAKKKIEATMPIAQISAMASSLSMGMIVNSIIPLPVVGVLTVGWFAYTPWQAATAYDRKQQIPANKIMHETSVNVSPPLHNGESIYGTIQLGPLRKGLPS